MFRRSLVGKAVAVALALGACATSHAQSDEARSLIELRNTVVNLLEALVQKGVMTREQAESMVADAQSKAEAEATAKAQQDAAEEGAVRVTYVPETVRQQISEQVQADLRPVVTQDVIAQARVEQWGVPGALPDWIKGVEIYGDVRARGEADLYADDNAVNTYLDFNAINAAGGIGRAGLDAPLNTTEDRYRMVGRARVGLEARVGESFTVDLRLATGNADSVVSTNHTLGDYNRRWEVRVDRAAIRWAPVSADLDHGLDMRFGRFANPFVTTNELVWDTDLAFEGISASYAIDLFGRDAGRLEPGLFVTAGAFPLQEIELSSDDKWLFGGQLGTEVPIGEASRIRFAAAYYDYRHITGIRNSPDSILFDYTAPELLSKGNTLFDIRNSSTDTTANLFALAGEYKLVNANLLIDLAAFGANHVMIGADYVKNIGWDSDEVAARIGQTVDERTEGYEVSVTVGRPALSAAGHWRAFMLYRYLQRDAVLDAFTDSDFHLGGTDAKGYQLGFDLGLSSSTWMRLRYLSANEIDGPPLGIDVLQLDLNAQF